MPRVLLAVVISWSCFAPAPVRAAERTWVRPVDGPVVKPFVAPKTRFGPGHLGVHLRAAPGTPVRAAGDGRVVFAGKVAYSRHIVIRHWNGWRTTYSFVASMRVHVGARVRAGEVIGTTGGRGPNHDGTVLHLGLRIGDTYVDPMQLFDARDLADRVHLAPLNPHQ
ncbi:MAG TPA: M23 family metallopeptidase [Acidimicrobiia bacterium]|nr:M23 family metallopeptidase [Acidimicrobiia bacterium]